MQSPPAETQLPSIPADLPRRSYTIDTRADWLAVRDALESAGESPAIVEVTLGPGEVTWPTHFSDIPAIHLILRGVGPATVLHGSLSVRDAASVEVRDLRFGALEESSSALTVDATHSITLRNLSFLDQIGAPVTTGRGAISTDHVAKLTVDNGGAVALSDVTVLGARGGWPAVGLVAPKGTVTIARTLVAGGDRPPFFVGATGALTIEDSVLVAPPGKKLFATQWPPGSVTLRRTTVVADTPVIVHPGSNPQAPASRYLPARVSDATLYVRTSAPGHGEGVTAEGAAIRPAPADAVDLPALRARAEALAPVDRAVLAPLLGLPEP